MAGKSPRQRSLFGGYVPPPRETRGRKRIAWDSEVAETIAILAARGATQAEMAQRVGLSVKTLTRIYADELERSADLIKHAVFEAQVREAAKGKTSAAKFVFSELKGEEAIAFRPRRAVQPPPARKGKKELQQEAAEAVGGLYAPRRPPPQAVN